MRKIKRSRLLKEALEKGLQLDEYILQRVREDNDFIIEDDIKPIQRSNKENK